MSKLIVRDLPYYDWCVNADIISRVRVLLEQNGYFLRDVDGKIACKSKLGWNTPWHHVYHAGNLDCNTWHKIMFDVIASHMPDGRRFVPSQCQNCYKVVVRPKSIKQLFALLELEKRLKRPSKCGIETRPTVHGLYGGYFYNWGLEAGLECYEVVREEVSKDKYLGPDVAVILKRACTEFEHACGPSDRWRVTEEQLVIEDMVNQHFVRDVKNYKQPDHAIAFIHRKWIEWAYQNGDPTYKEFTGGKPLYPDYVTYHDKLQENPK